MLRNEFKGKSILIAVPDFVGYPEGFKVGLEALGFNVHLIRNYEYAKIGLWNTLIHVYKKIVLGVRTFKKEKRKKLDYSKQLEDLKQTNCDHFDFALFIRPDLFATELIEFVSKKTDLVAAYQWDGLDVYPEVYTRIALFKRFFVFDENDLKKNKTLLPLTNFYFDCFAQKEIDIDVYFVGYYKDDRIEGLLNLSRKLRDLGLKISINICVNSSRQVKRLKNEPINILYNQLTFMENIANVSRSKIIIDVANIVHNGLSMRPFEALGYQKKLITNNALIKSYDFYNENNIFVIEDGKLDGLLQFIDSPYKNLPDALTAKYSFSNWIKYVLDMEPHLPLDFPPEKVE